MAADDSPSFRIAASFPGRMRLQFAGPEMRNGRFEELAARVAALDGVFEVEVVRDARSLIVRYAPARCEPPRILAQLDRSAAAGARTAGQAGEAPSRPTLSENGAAAGGPRVPRRRAGAARQELAVLHWFPGRLRLKVPHLHGAAHLAESLEEGLTQHRGIHAVEAQPEHAWVVVQYDSRVHSRSRVLRLVDLGMRRALRNSSREVNITRAGQLLAKERPHLHPLALPTLAVGLAALGSVPAALTGTVMALAGLPVAARALEGVRTRRLNVDQLDLAALLLLGGLGNFVTGGLMTWLIGLGELIRGRTARRARRAVSELMSTATQRAWLDRDGTLVSVPVDRLSAGDLVVVYPGDRVPVDGVVVAGRGLIDQKLLTGEATPAPKEPGDPVYALTVVADGQLSVRVEHIGRETRAGRVVRMIEDAPLSDTRIQNYAAMVGDRLVGPIFALAGAAFLWSRDLARMTSILILDFATPIRVSAPTTILSAMTGALGQGLFIKGGRAMEQLARVDAVVFDKTGTLTLGEPYVAEVETFDAAFSADDVLQWAASAEANLKHPAARALVSAAAARGLEATQPSEMEYFMGLGVRARVGEHLVDAGSERYLRQLDVDTSAALIPTRRNHELGYSTVYVAVDGRLAGMVAYSDPPRREAREVLRALSDRRVRRIVMLTGDNARAAEAVASELGITDFVSEAFPEQKAEIVQQLRDEGYTVAVIGDGINDSPAFTRADVSISLQHGAEVAKETADVILLDGDLHGLPRAMDLSREAVRVLNQNVNLVMWPTALGIGAAVAGFSNPLISTLINNGAGVITSLNALRPLLGGRTAGSRILPPPEPHPPASEPAGNLRQESRNARLPADPCARGPEHGAPRRGARAAVPRGRALSPGRHDGRQ